MIKIGNLFFLIAMLFNSTAQAAINAVLDRNQVPQDESISLKITQTGNTGGSFAPRFEAPDFEVMNQFESSQFSSVYVNGKFENKSEKSVTFILRPLKIGTLKIRAISNQGEHAPDLSVQVVRENSYQKSVGENAPSLQGDQRNFFVRAELSKTKAYKGEQVIASFYLYRRTKANMRDVMQYPSFEGFIREDLEMPILSGRLEYEAVNLGGVPFERGLLARYAVYPIKEGKLKIEGFSIRADYIPRNAANDDLMEDPFFQFFSQVTPRTGTSKSDPVTIDVMPLPEEGRGPNFTGGVGDFDVSAQVDQTQIKSNAPLTLKISVKGHGNASLIEFPKVTWPKEFRLYESQGRSKNLGQGMTEKSFDVVIIPQQTGELVIPSIPFEFFNPSTRTYVQKKTDQIKINVSQGEAAATEHPVEEVKPEASVGSSPSTENQKNYGNIRTNETVKTEEAGSFLGQPWWRWIAWAGLLVLIAFLGLVAFDHLKKKSLLKLEILKKKEKIQSIWSQFSRDAKDNPLPQLFERVSDQLYKTLDEEFGITSRSLPLRDLAKLLTEKHSFTADQWKSLSKVFEFSEMIRFASQSTPHDSELRQQAQEMIELSKNLCAAITSKKLES